MNWIRTDGRFAPYSHRPGVVFPLFGTSFAVQVFPTQLRLLCGKEGIWKSASEISFGLQGPLEEFTAQLDLLSGRLAVFGKSTAGWLRYEIDHGTLRLKKMPFGMVSLSVDGKKIDKAEGEVFSWCPSQQSEGEKMPPLEKLSLGNHKTQDLSSWKQQLDPTSVWPAWFLLGQWVQEACDGTVNLGEMGGLLQEWQQAIEGGRPERIVPAWSRFFLAAFSDCLIPRFVDAEHWGIVPDAIPPQTAPWLLLRKGQELLRRLFVEEQGQELFFLPHLPPECHAGRIHLFLGEGPLSTRCDVEWTKKRIRRLCFLSLETREWVVHFKEIKQFRLRHRIGDKGVLLETGAKILLQEGQPLLLDHFTK